MAQALSLLVSLLLVSLCAAFPWLMQHQPTRLIVSLFGGSVAVAILGVLFSVGPYPWTNLIVLGVALSAGLWLGRGATTKPGAFLILLLVLSILDIVQVVLSTPTLHTGIPPASALYGNMFLLVPWGRFNVGIFDLFLITAMAEVWRKRGAPYGIALVPGVVGMSVGYLCIFLITHGTIPLIPFLTAGWLVTAPIMRLLHMPTMPPSPAVVQQRGEARM